MGKKSAKSKKPKRSIKIKNKSINKLNRPKKNKPKSNKIKEIKNAIKVRFLITCFYCLVYRQI
jgi:hypothetical protein